MAKPGPQKTSSLTAPAKDFAGLKARLEGLHAAMKSNAQYSVKKFAIGPPRAKASGDVEPLASLAAAFDGATFEWELRGTEKTSGVVRFPTYKEILATKGQGLRGPNAYSLIPGLKHASIELQGPGDDVSVIDRESRQSRTDGIDVISAFDAQVDSLGIPTWELRYYDDLDETEDEDDPDGLFVKQGEVLDAVDRAWAAMGLRAP